MNIIQWKLWQKTFQNMWKGKRVFNNGEVLFFSKEKKRKTYDPNPVSEAPTTGPLFLLRSPLL
jgi:hypothetical protein